MSCRHHADNLVCQLNLQRKEAAIMLREPLLTPQLFNQTQPYSSYRDNFYLPIQAKIIITVSYFYSIVLSYALMLVVMSFNGGLFLATCFGLAFGYFIFGYMKKRSKELVKMHAGSEKIYNPEGDKCCADVDFE